MKKTNLFSCLTTLMVMLTFMSSCQKTGTYYDVIPVDVTAVVAVNVKNIAEKGDVTELFQTQVKPMLTGVLDAATAQKAEQILSDGKESGVDLEQRIFIFGVLEEKIGGVVARVSDESKLNELFATLKKETEEKSGYRLVRIEDNILCAYNKTSLLICGGDLTGQLLEESVAKWMKQGADKSMSANEGCQKMLAMADDLNFFMNIGQGLKQYAQLQTLISMPDMTKMDYLGGINFENGKIVLNIEYFTTDKTLMELYEKQAAAYGKINNTFLNCFPETTMLYITSNCNGKKLFEMMGEYKMWEAMKIKPTDAQQLVEAFNGDIAFGLLSLSTTGIPSFVTYAEVDNNGIVETLVGLQTQFGMYTQLISMGENAYEVKIPMLNMSVWFGMQDKHFYLTNDPAIYAKIGQDVENPLGNSQYAVNVKKSYSALLLNMEKMQQSLQMVWQMAGVYGPIIKNILSNCEYFEIYNQTMNKCILNIYTKDKDQNVLKAMFQGTQNLI